MTTKTPTAPATGDDSLTWLFGPFATTAVAAGAGYGLRVGTGLLALGIAVVVLLVPAAVLGIALLLGRPLFGIDQPTEVAYVGGVLAALAAWTAAVGTWSWPLAAFAAAAVAGGVTWWLAWGPGQRVPMLADFLAAAAGLLALAGLNPLTDPAPWRWIAAAVGGTAIGATPYWMHRRVKIDNAPIVAEAVASLAGAFGKHMRNPVEVLPDSVNIGEHGRYGVTLRLSNGKTAANVVAAIVAVESELGLREGAIVAAGRRARRNEVTVTVTPDEPTTAELERPPLPTSITQLAAIGRYDSGDLMWVSLYDQDGARGLLGGGQKGSGKSRGMWTLLEAWTHADDVLFLFGDMSGGATSEPWLPCLYRRYTKPADVLRLLTALEAAAVWRASQLPLRGWESWQPSHAHPAIVVPIDEGQSLLKNNWQAQQVLERLTQIDRKSGISVVLLQPNPVQMEGVSPTIREQMRIRLCWRSPGSAVRWVLGGTRAEPASYAVREFSQPGQVLGDGPGMEPLPGRTFDTPLPRAKASAIAHAGRRPVLDAGTAAAMAKATATAKNPAGEDWSRPQYAIDQDLTDDDDPGERWTEADDAAAAAAAMSDDDVRSGIASMVASGVALGKELPPLPEVEIPTGRLSTEQALRVVGVMLGQEGGARPAEIERMTGRSRAWVNDVLATWRDQGAAENYEYGKWRVPVSATRSDGGSGAAG